MTLIDMMKSAPTFLQLAGNRKSILDSFSVIAALNKDLKGSKYEAEVQTDSQPKKQKTEKKSASSGRRSLRDYEKGNYTEEDLIRGFDDGEGGVRFAIGYIVEYHPKKGVLVHWKGWGESDRTWETLDNIPEDWDEEVADAKRKFETQNSARKSKK